MKNLPFAVYRCDRIEKRLLEPSEFVNEVMVSGHLTTQEACEEARRLKASDPEHCYTVGEA